ALRHRLGKVGEKHGEPEPERDRQDEPGALRPRPDQGRHGEECGEEAAHSDDEHHRVPLQVAWRELAEGITDGGEHELAVEERAGLGSHGGYRVNSWRCSTTGPSARAGRNVSAPTRRTVPTRST